MTHLDRSVLADDVVLASPLVRDGAFRQLATCLLAAFPNTTQTGSPRPGPDEAAPATVRRAVEFMDSHARQEIDIVRIAEAARIGPRGRQAAFRKHRGQTPLEYLRVVRAASPSSTDAPTGACPATPSAGFPDRVMCRRARWSG